MVPSPNGNDSEHGGDATTRDGGDDISDTSAPDGDYPGDGGEHTRNDVSAESTGNAGGDENREGTYDGTPDESPDLRGTHGAPANGENDDGISRRALLAAGLLLGGGGGAALLALSGGGAPGTDGTETPTGGATPTAEATPSGPRYSKEVYDVWREMRAATRASPDHLPAKAERLVEEGDPQAIYEFVRDEIRTIPADRPGDNSGWWTFPRRMRWGPRGTLRGGTGTIRDKAELLADLYERAGYDTTMLRVPIGAIETTDAKKLLLNDTGLSYQPDTSTEQMQRWLETTGGEPKEPASIDAATISELASELVDQLPSTAKKLTSRSTVTLSWPDSVELPVVRLRVYGDKKYANLWNLEATLDEPKMDVKRDYAEMDDPKTRSVRVRLEASKSDNANQRETLVSGEWDLPDLVGRQIQVQTLPGIDPLQRPGTRFSDVRTFVPALSVQDVHADRNALQSLSRTGKPFTLDGNRYTVEYDGTVKYGDTVLLKGGKGGGTSGSSNAGSNVQTVEVEANASAYPEVRLNVNALDDAGNTVEGLPASAFNITEDGESVVASMETNTKAPRVIVYYDTSASVGLSGFYKEDRKQFRKRMRRDIKSVNPDAKVEFFEAGSNAWKYMAEAATRRGNLLIYLSDAHGYSVSDKQKTPERVTAIKEGPPTIMLSTTGKKYETQKEMAELSDGTAIALNNSEKTREAIKKYVGDLQPQLTAYTFRYRSPNVDVPEAPVGTKERPTPTETATETETPTATETATGTETRTTATTDGQETHTVTVEVPAGEASGSSTYTVPPENRRVEPERISKLYLTIEVGNRAVERVLADATDSNAESSNTKDDGTSSERRKRKRPILRALFEDRTLSIEGSAPRLGVRLDDYLASKLSVEDLHRSAAKGNVEKVEKVRKKGASVIPPAYLSLHEPIYRPVSDSSVTYEVDPRITLTSTTPRFGTKTIGIEGDLLHYRLATAGEDKDSQFEKTVEKSLRLAFVEGALYDRSTQSLLDDKSLVRYRRAKKNLSRKRMRKWNRLLRNSGFRSRSYPVVPEGGDPMAHYSIDRWSGTAIGVLPDGTGGGQSVAGINKLLNQYARVISMLNLYISAAEAAGAVSGPGAFALGAVASYYQLLARLYAAAGVTILTMDASQLKDEVAKGLARFTCQIHMAIIGETVPGWEMDAFDGLNNIIGAMGGTTACAVPDVDID